MKPILTSLFLLLCCSPLYSQTMFAPPGSEWYHSMGDGVFHSYYAGDTVISGTACRMIIRNANVEEPEASQGLHVDDLPTLYLYNTTDTVFVYNNIFSRFTPLYVFNVNDGDTVRLPILPDDICQLTYISTDSTFSFRVDSVRMKQFDTASLKTIYTRPLGTISSNYVYAYSAFSDTVGAYAEQLGALHIGIMPSGGPAACLTTESLQLAGNVRCYADPALSVHLVSGLCGLPPEHVTTPVEKQAIFVSPNPAVDYVTVANLTENAAVDVFDLAGRVAYQIKAGKSGTIIPVSFLQAGVYVLKIIQPGIPPEYRKISVVH